MPWQRTGTCDDCGECCGANGDSPFPSRGFEAVRNWSIDDINESYALWTVLGIGLDGEDNPAIITPNGFYRVRGTQYFYTWQEAKAGFGTIPMKDTSAAHDGSSYSSECPFLQDDSGDGKRPCALVGSQDDGLRAKYCRPEERPDYVPADDIWNDNSKQEWENDHPNCSYTWVEVT